MKFKLLGTEIYISFLFSAVLAFMIATDRTGLCIPTLFAAFIHETGHLLALWACDCQPKAIRLIPASVQIVRGFSKKRYGEAAISLCGPLANAVVFLALFINYSITKSEISLQFGLLNLILAVFNMLPVSGLDGGTLLTLAIARFTDINRAEGIVRIITALFSALCFLTGVYLWVSGKANLSLFIVAVYLLCCSLMKR